MKLECGLTNGQSAANDHVQPYGPQPRWKRRQLRNIAVPAFVGCISGLGGAARRSLRLPLLRFDELPDDDSYQCDSDSDTQVAEVALAHTLAFLPPLPSVKEVPDTPEAVFRSKHVPRIVPPRQSQRTVEARPRRLRPTFAVAVVPYVGSSPGARLGGSG